MAITRYSSFDKTVNTIAERNAIVNKVNHMTVVVKDAIADPSAGAGKAIYRWDAVDNVWILVSKSTYETISFATEELTITNGEVQLSNYPVDNKIWNAVILNNQLIYADLNLNEVTVSNSKVTGISSDYNGYILRVTYAYGSVSVQINAAIEDGIDAALLNNVKTINGTPIIGTGNIVVEGVLPSMKTINGESLQGSGDIVTTQTTITGNAGTATKLQTARTINGVSFDGTANITITDSTKQPTLVSGTNIKTINGVSVLGSGDITISGGATLTNDSTTNSNFYPVFTTSTSGSMTAASVSSTKLYFNPSTGILNATQFNAFSDRNLKENINTIDNSLDIINKLNAVSFNWKDTGVKSYGVIAQELEEVLPELVNTNDDGFKSVNYDGLIGILLAAVQALSKR